MPSSIRLDKAARAGLALQTAAKAADKDNDDLLTTAEIRAAKGQNGAAATNALLRYHAQHRALTRRDPEIPADQMGNEMKYMYVSAIKANVDEGVKQLERIDSYGGNQRRGVKANRKDGVVTDAEIKNYGRTGGKLQMEAAPLATFTRSFRG